MTALDVGSIRLGRRMLASRRLATNEDAHHGIQCC